MDFDVFDLENFNVFQDEDNYYFFRALNKADSKDISDGTIIDENGKIIRIRTDRERYEKKPKYNQNSNISLEEMFDHIKVGYRPDTNCISLSSNTNVSAVYGRKFYNDTYAMIRVPKDELGKTVFHAGPYMMEKIQKVLDEYLDTEELDGLVKYYIDSINFAKNEEAIDKILKSYEEDRKNPEIFKKGIEYGFEPTQVSEYNALNKNQNLEKRKLIAKLDVIGKRILPHVSNKFLIQTVGGAFSSLELIHYKDIDGNQIIPISKEVIDMLSIVQQLPVDISEPIKRELLEKVLNNDLVYSEFSYNDKVLQSSNYSIEEMYNLTNGNIDYNDAINIRNRAFYLAKSKLRTKYIIDNLNRNLPQYQDVFEKEQASLYGIEPEIFSRLSKHTLNVSESVSLDLSENEKTIFEFINSLSNAQLQNVVNNPIDTLSTLLENHPEFGNDKLPKDEYFASAIVDMYDWSRLNIKSILPDQRKEIIDKLIDNNCVDIYEDLKNHNISEEYIPLILLTKVIKDLDYDDIDLNEGFSVDELEDFLGYYEVNDTKIRLRSYQAAAVENIEETFKEKQFVSAILPTGSGKSFVALTEMQQYQDKKILYLAPNEEILNQLSNHIVKYIHGTKYTTGKEREQIIKESFPNLTLCTYAYLTDNHPEIRDEKYDLIIWDELHRTGAKEWGRNLQKMVSHQDENTKILSVTATPQRDMDNRNMSDEWARQFGYTQEEIDRHKHLAINMNLEEGIRQGFVMHPKIVNCEYNLQNGELDNLLEILKSYEDSEQKTRILSKFDELRDRVAKADKVDKILKDNIKKGGKYIVFLPVTTKNGRQIEDDDGNQVDSRITGKSLVEEYQKTLIKDLAGFIDEDDIEFHSMLAAYSKSKNKNELSKFENNDSDKTQFMLVINKLNEGKHVDGVNGMIWYRPLDENSRILYLQQLGRIVYGIDPTKELSDDERTIAIDLVNNTYRVNINRKNREVTNDVDKLNTIISWINLHGGKIPDINSTNRQEARYGSTLKRMQMQYSMFLEDMSLIEREPNKGEINEILFLGNSIDLWCLDIPERIRQDNKELLEEDFELFSVTGILRDLYELNQEINALGLEAQKEKIHEYRMIVEKLGRLPKNREHIKFSDGTDSGYYWYDAEEKLKQVARMGNEDAIYILNVAENNKINKLHEYRMIVEELGRLPKQSDGLTFSDGKSVDYYIFNFLDRIKSDAKVGVEDAKFILEMRKRQQKNKINKTRELKTIIEQLGRFPNRNDNKKFSDGSDVLDYFQYSRRNLQAKAGKGNEEAIYILEYHQKQIESKNPKNKLHEYRLAVEEKGRLIGKGREDEELVFSDNTKMGLYWNNKGQTIKQLAEEGDEDAIAILKVANNKIDKVHEYRLIVEKLGRLVTFSKEDKNLQFSDGSSMTYYWRRNEETLRKIASEGSEDAIAILNIANKNIIKAKETERKRATSIARSEEILDGKDNIEKKILP